MPLLRESTLMINGCRTSDRLSVTPTASAAAVNDSSSPPFSSIALRSASFAMRVIKIPTTTAQCDHFCVRCNYKKQLELCTTMLDNNGNRGAVYSIDARIIELAKSRSTFESHLWLRGQLLALSADTVTT